MIIVSACLAGVNCRYDGKNNANEKVVELVSSGKAMLVCPEQLGGLSTPRIPAEIVGDKIINKKGFDVTDNFIKGANEALRIAQLVGCKTAILKESSPSCGFHKVYDGTFTGTKIEGKGVTAKLFSQNKIKILSENEI